MAIGEPVTKLFIGKLKREPLKREAEQVLADRRVMLARDPS